ncbi:MAG TPA: response regulator [Planctomycetota bacterium]|nr:response regulator [Planctomycetota bacterium]
MAPMRYEACFPMLIDGDREFLPVLRTAFLNAGVPLDQIRSFHDASDAIIALTETSVHLSPPMKSPPSFVLIDLELPGRSGLEVLRWMRITSPFMDLPVFVLSSKGTAELITQALDLKVRSYFLKPDAFRELEAIVEGMLAHWFRRSQGPMV